jgi:hypothetical protein
MSERDGGMRHDMLYTTSDTPFAAYLVHRGFELLGAIDSGEARKEFGLTSTDPEVLYDLEKTIARARDEFDNMWLAVPHAPQIRLNFSEYAKCLKNVQRTLSDAIKKDKQ